MTVNFKIYTKYLLRPLCKCELSLFLKKDFEDIDGMNVFLHSSHTATREWVGFFLNNSKHFYKSVYFIVCVFLRKKCRYSSKLFSTNTKNIYSTFMRILKIWTYLYEKKMYLFNKNLEFFFLLLMWICQYFGFLIPNLATLLLMYIKLFTHLALNFHFCPKLSMIVKQIFRFKQEFWALYSVHCTLYEYFRGL